MFLNEISKKEKKKYKKITLNYKVYSFLQRNIFIYSNHHKQQISDIDMLYNYLYLFNSLEKIDIKAATKTSRYSKYLDTNEYYYKTFKLEIKESNKNFLEEKEV